MGSLGLARGGAGTDALGEGLLRVRTGRGYALAEGQFGCRGIRSFDGGTLYIRAVGQRRAGLR